jgi:hypothetical protein
MSLFENDAYRWRETYFVYLQRQRCPKPEAIERALEELGGRYQREQLRCGEDGQFESLTVISPEDYAAMDITYLAGEEITEQRGEMEKQVAASLTGQADREKLSRLRSADARFEVYHFEQLIQDGPEGEMDDFFLDPGSLLLVLEAIAGLCDGVIVDPQSGCLL